MDRPGCLDVATDADTMGSVQSPALACDQLVASGFCARLALQHSSALFVPCSALCTSAFLPTFPPRGFARRASRGSSPQQDYAGSDSCRPLARSTGLSAYSACLPKYPDPNHMMCPKRRFSSHLSASGRAPKVPRLRHAVAGSPTHPAETGSSSYGLLVRLQLLPTPPRGDAVTLSYAWRDYHAAGTCTLLTQRPHGRTTAGLRPTSPLPAREARCEPVVRLDQH